MNMTMKAQGVSDKRKIRPFSVRQGVVALELGAIDKGVLDYVDFLTEKIPVESLHFVHVLPRFDLFNVLYEKDQESLISNYELNREVIARMQDDIRLRPGSKRCAHISFDVKEGNPLEEILKNAEDLNADLVVIGQRSGKEYHGILARNLSRKIKGNALIIPEKAERRLRNILVPIDFSADSIKALQTALAIRQRQGSEIGITCLNVFEMPNLSVYKIQKSREEFKRMMMADRESAFKVFLATHAAEEADNINTALVEQSNPNIASFIMDYAGKFGHDLIVMGAKGHSKVELLLLGSVTEKLLSSNDRIPTLVVKEDPGAY